MGSSKNADRELRIMCILIMIRVNIQILRLTQLQHNSKRSFAARRRYHAVAAVLQSHSGTFVYLICRDCEVDIEAMPNTNSLPQSSQSLAQ